MQSIVIYNHTLKLLLFYCKSVVIWQRFFFIETPLFLYSLMEVKILYLVSVETIRYSLHNRKIID
jgi:hypothetical protein